MRIKISVAAAILFLLLLNRHDIFSMTVTLPVAEKIVRGAAILLRAAARSIANPPTAIPRTVQAPNFEQKAEQNRPVIPQKMPSPDVAINARLQVKELNERPKPNERQESIPDVLIQVPVSRMPHEPIGASPVPQMPPASGNGAAVPSMSIIPPDGIKGLNPFTLEGLGGNVGNYKAYERPQPFKNWAPSYELPDGMCFRTSYSEPHSIPGSDYWRYIATEEAQFEIAMKDPAFAGEISQWMGNVIDLAIHANCAINANGILARFQLISMDSEHVYLDRFLKLMQTQLMELFFDHNGTIRISHNKESVFALLDFLASTFGNADWSKVKMRVADAIAPWFKENSLSAYVPHDQSRDTIAVNDFKHRRALILTNISNKKLLEGIELLYEDLYKADAFVDNLPHSTAHDFRAVRHKLELVKNGILADLKTHDTSAYATYTTYNRFGFNRIFESDVLWQAIPQKDTFFAGFKQEQIDILSAYFQQRLTLFEELGQQFKMRQSEVRDMQSFMWSLVNHRLHQSEQTKLHIASFVRDACNDLRIGHNKTVKQDLLKYIKTFFKNDAEVEQYVFLAKKNKAYVFDWVAFLKTIEQVTAGQSNGSSPGGQPMRENEPCKAESDKSSTSIPLFNQPTAGEPGEERLKTPGATIPGISIPGAVPQQGENVHTKSEVSSASIPNVQAATSAGSNNDGPSEASAMPHSEENRHKAEGLFEALLNGAPGVKVKPKKKKDEKDPCDTANLIDGVVDKKQLEDACHEFLKTPGAWEGDGPLKIVYRDLNIRNSWREINKIKNDVKGFMFELQVALKLVKMGRGINQFGLKCEKKEKILEVPGEPVQFIRDESLQDSFIDLDIITSDGVAIECKNTQNWSYDLYGKSAKDARHQFLFGAYFAQRCRPKYDTEITEIFDYEVHSATPVPDNWKKFMKENGVTNIVDTYCPPDCGLKYVE